MIEPVRVLADGGVEVRPHPRVVDKVKQRAAPVDGVEEPVRQHVGRTLRLDVSVDLLVQTPKLIGVEGVRHRDVALQIVEVFFVLVHRFVGTFS